MKELAAGLALAMFMTCPANVSAAPIRYAGNAAELSVSAISEHTVQIVLAPLDEKGQARSAPPSTVLVELRSALKLRRRELSRAETGCTN
jgi:hypothetical protein